MSVFCASLTTAMGREPGTYWTDASWLDAPLNSRTCVTSPTARASACTEVLVESLRTAVHCDPSSRHTHVPVLLGSTAHHVPLYFHSFDWGFSPVPDESCFVGSDSKVGCVEVAAFTTTVTSSLIV